MSLKEELLKIETQAEYDLKREKFRDLLEDGEVQAHLKAIHGKGYVYGDPKGFIGELYKTPPGQGKQRIGRQ